MVTNWFKAYQGIFDDIHKRTWSMDQIVQDIEDRNLFERYCETWQEEWRKMLPTQKERELLFDVTPEARFEARRNYLLNKTEKATRDYYEAIQNKLEPEVIKELAKKRGKAQLRYFFFTYRPETKEGLSERDIEQARATEMRTLIEANKAGFALCPFHNEKTASLKVFKNLWYCFGCSTGGDSIRFIMKKEGLDFIKAVKFLLK